MKKFIFKIVKMLFFIAGFEVKKISKAKYSKFDNVEYLNPNYRNIATLKKIHTLNDLKIQSHSVKYIMDLDSRNISEKNLKKLFFKIMQICQPKLFVEVGAMNADAAIHVRKLLPKCRVVAFEANPYNYEYYYRSYDYEELSIEYINKACFDGTANVIKMFIKSRDGKNPKSKILGSHSLKKRNDNKIEYDEVEVQAITLDEYFKSNIKTNFMWIDVEGAQREVLKGSMQVLNNSECIIIEVEDEPFWEDQWLSIDIVNYLKSFDMIPIARDFEYEKQYNILFMKTSLLKEAKISEFLVNILY